MTAPAGWPAATALVAQRRAIQATARSRSGTGSAGVGWVIASVHQSPGYAHGAAKSMVTWLREQAATVTPAQIHPYHLASTAAARAIGPGPTGDADDGEVRWFGGFVG